MDKPLPNRDVPRYTERPLPDYRHLPFQNPHPFLDEDGHSYGEKLEPVAGFGPDNWRDCREYLYAVDLFNHGFWWEAHERLKPLSISAGRETPAGIFLQGVVQLAAALLKHHLEEPQPAGQLAEMGRTSLIAAEADLFGIDARLLADGVQACLEEDAAAPVIRLAGLPD